MSRLPDIMRYRDILGDNDRVFRERGRELRAKFEAIERLQEAKKKKPPVRITKGANDFLPDDFGVNK